MHCIYVYINALLVRVLGFVFVFFFQMNPIFWKMILLKYSFIHNNKFLVPYLVFSSDYRKILSVALRIWSLSHLSVHSTHWWLHLRINWVKCHWLPLKSKPELILIRSKKLSVESILDFQKFCISHTVCTRFICSSCGGWDRLEFMNTTEALFCFLKTKIVLYILMNLYWQSCQSISSIHLLLSSHLTWPPKGLDVLPSERLSGNLTFSSE